MTPKRYNELQRQADVLEQDKKYSQTLQRVVQHNAINDHLKMVNDAKDKMAALAKELDADSYRVSWSIEDEGDGVVEYRCRVGIHMPFHWMGSYVSADHPFEKAEKTIRDTHAAYAEEQLKRKRLAEEELIKRALYEDYLAQKSSAKS